MSAEACNTAMLLEPLAGHGWSRLGPTCECCGAAGAVARCWFRVGFAFTACPSCASVIALHEVVAFALRRVLSA